MSAWRVTYLPESAAGTRRLVSVVVEDPESSSLGSFTARLSGGNLGQEWTHGRVIQSIESLEFNKRRHRRVILAAIVAPIVIVAIVIGGYYVPIPHSWSFSIYSSGECPNGCSNQVISQSYPNGSQVSGSWSAPQPAGMQILTTHGLVCPSDGTSSGPDGCSQPWVTSGSFSFTSVGGTVTFVAFSANPENITVSGTWSAPAW